MKTFTTTEDTQKETYLQGDATGTAYSTYLCMTKSIHLVKPGTNNEKRIGRMIRIKEINSFFVAQSKFFSEKTAGDVLEIFLILDAQKNRSSYGTWISDVAPAGVNATREIWTNFSLTWRSNLQPPTTPAQLIDTAECCGASCDTEYGDRFTVLAHHRWAVNANTTYANGLSDDLGAGVFSTHTFNLKCDIPIYFFNTNPSVDTVETDVMANNISFWVKRINNQNSYHTGS